MQAPPPKAVITPSRRGGGTDPRRLGRGNQAFRCGAVGQADHQDGIVRRQSRSAHVGMGAIPIPEPGTVHVAVDIHNFAGPVLSKLQAAQRTNPPDAWARASFER